MKSSTLSARWIFPGNASPLADGTITLSDGRIESIDPKGKRTPDFHFGNAAIIPGLVNAHTHLDLSGLYGKIPPTPNFTSWLKNVISFRRSQALQQTQRDIRLGLDEILSYGTTLVGDIASGGLSWNVLAKSPIWSVVYRELIGLPKTNADRSWLDCLDWLAKFPSTERCRVGLSPHAPYSVRWSLFRSVAILGTRHHIPIAIHTAESFDELLLLCDPPSGPFVDFLQDLGVWDQEGLIDWEEFLEDFQQTPLTAFIHSNYLEMQLPSKQAKHLFRVFCPRTRHAFGFSSASDCDFHDPNSTIAFGTDSLASNPDLDVFSEAVFLAQQKPDIPLSRLLRSLTLDGAKVLGWSDVTGSLVPGKSADLVVIPLPDREPSDPYELLFDPDNNTFPRKTMWQGNWRD